MKRKSSLRLALLFSCSVLCSNVIFAQDGKAEHNYLQGKTGEWSVVMTFRPRQTYQLKSLKGWSQNG